MIIGNARGWMGRIAYEYRKTSMLKTLAQWERAG
jgi:hypothetical protein